MQLSISPFSRDRKGLSRIQIFKTIKSCEENFSRLWTREQSIFTLNKLLFHEINCELFRDLFKDCSDFIKRGFSSFLVVCFPFSLQKENKSKALISYHKTFFIIKLILHCRGCPFGRKVFYDLVLQHGFCGSQLDSMHCLFPNKYQSLKG